MSNVYDNWERLVGAVIRREELWQMFHDSSPSISSVSSDFSLDSQVLDVPFDFSSRSGTSLYQLPAVENSQKKKKSVKKGSSVLEMRVKRRDAIQWMSYGLLPESLRERIRWYDKYLLIRNLPKDLSKDIMRHICLAFLKRVPMFETMDDQLLEAMCDRLNPVLYYEDSFVWQEGDTVDEMLFIMRGKLLSVTGNGERTAFPNYVHLKGGDFCGEELLPWALDPKYSSNLPISTRTVQAHPKAEVFTLAADDLKFVVSQFRHLHGSKQMRYIFRFYSLQWRNWAASLIQVEWRHYCRKKLVREEENSSPYALAKARMQKRMSLILLQRPYEPDFTAEEEAARAIQLAWHNYYKKKLIREEENSSPDALAKARMQNRISLLLQRLYEPDFTAEEEAAWAIQLAWHNYYKKKLIREEANRFQDALAKEIMLPAPAEPVITAE